MINPQLIFVAGCNAAGKSGFIRFRISELDDFKIVMTDVYKGRTKTVLSDADLSIIDKNENWHLDLLY